MGEQVPNKYRLRQFSTTVSDAFLRFAQVFGKRLRFSEMLRKYTDAQGRIFRPAQLEFAGIWARPRPMKHDLALYSSYIQARLPRSTLKRCLPDGLFDRGANGGHRVIEYQKLVGKAHFGKFLSSAAFDFDGDRLRRVTLKVLSLGNYASAADFERAWASVNRTVHEQGGELVSMEDAEGKLPIWRSHWRIDGIPIQIEGRSGKAPEITVMVGFEANDPSMQTPSLEDLFPD